MKDQNWYRPTGMDYVVYVPANDCSRCIHPNRLECRSVIVGRNDVGTGWVFTQRINARQITTSPSFRTQAAAKRRVEEVFGGDHSKLAVSPFVADPANPTDEELSAAIQRGLAAGTLIDAADWLARTSAEHEEG